MIMKIIKKISCLLCMLILIMTGVNVYASDDCSFTVVPPESFSSQLQGQKIDITMSPVSDNPAYQNMTASQLQEEAGRLLRMVEGSSYANRSGQVNIEVEYGADNAFHIPCGTYLMHAKRLEVDGSAYETVPCIIQLSEGMSQVTVDLKLTRLDAQPRPPKQIINARTGDVDWLRWLIPAATGLTLFTAGIIFYKKSNKYIAI